MNLSAIVLRTRGKLDDTIPTASGKYLWSNDDITGCINETINELCREARLIEDATTAAICTHALLANEYTLSISERIIGIERAWLVSTGDILDIVEHVRDMDDAYSPGWKAADSSVPKFLIKGGLGNGIARVWPATLLADTVNLTVKRLPLADMVYDTDSGSAPEIPERYHDQLYDGILARAYMKDDTDTLDLRKAKKHEDKWKEKIEEIRQAEVYRDFVPQAAVPALGHM